MRELAKMATGLVAKSGVGPCLRAILFVVVAAAAWRFCFWLDVTSRVVAGKPDLVIVLVFLLAVVNFIVICGCIIEGRLVNRGLRRTASWLPLALWADMTDDGENVRLWTILVWPFLVPGEMAVCVAAAIAFVSSGASWILNIRLK